MSTWSVFNANKTTSAAKKQNVLTPDSKPTANAIPIMAPDIMRMTESRPTNRK